MFFSFISRSVLLLHNELAIVICRAEGKKRYFHYYNITSFFIFYILVNVWAVVGSPSLVFSKGFTNIFIIDGVFWDFWGTDLLLKNWKQYFFLKKSQNYRQEVLEIYKNNLHFRRIIFIEIHCKTSYVMKIACY